MISSPSHYPHGGKVLSQSPGKSPPNGGNGGGGNGGGGNGGGEGSSSEQVEDGDVDLADLRDQISGIIYEDGDEEGDTGKLQDFLQNEPENPNSEEWRRWRIGCVMESDPMRYFIIFLVVVNGIIIGQPTKP